MKRILALMLALLLLAGCAQLVPQPEPQEPEQPTAAAETEPEAAAEEETPKQPERLTLAWNPEDSMNPLKAATSVNRQLMGLLYEGLFAAAGDGTTANLLCETFEVSADLKTYTFHLRQNVTMQDGKPLTEQDVISSLTTARWSERYSFRLRHMASVLSVQPGTVTVQLDTPYQHFEKLLDVPIFRAGTEEEALPVGTGPYRMLGERLFRTASYWREDIPYGRRIDLRSAATATALCGDFTDGVISAACVDLNGTATPIYHCAYDLYTCPTNTMQYLGFNLTGGLFSCEPLRHAITYLVDRETLTAELGSSFAVGAVLPADPERGTYDRTLALRYDFDENDYLAALEEADIRDRDGDGVLEYWDEGKLERAEGRLVVCSAYPERVALAKKLAETLQRKGVELSVHSLSPEGYRSALKNGNYDLYVGETTLPPDGDLSCFFDLRSELCLPGMASEAMLALCDAALENEGNFYTLYQAVMEQGWFCPVLFKQYAVYVQRGLSVTLTPGYGNPYFVQPEPEVQP